MALIDIVAQTGDEQDFILEIPVGNAGYMPSDILIGSGGVPLSVEIPIIVSGGGGGNIFIISE